MLTKFSDKSTQAVCLLGSLIEFAQKESDDSLGISGRKLSVSNAVLVIELELFGEEYVNSSGSSD